ncbi:MAG: polyprenol phosphomannose-dependent alpha 1,6 mannosyltransferase MptB [Candidatus Omnitrophota bacterium]|nr:polyprenol phosphomannose-dependent alpha 1,6 mannosyltransferase MptB [Candidatus Omnitrophota bacterium]
MEEKTKKKFILSHILLLVAFAVIYFMPYLASMAGDTCLPPMTRFVRFYMIEVFTTLFLCYYLFLYYYKTTGMTLFSSRGVSAYFWVATLAVFLLLCYSRAVLSTDLYEYSLRGRMFGIHGLNPYLHIPEEIKHDLFYSLIFWKKTPECYGPAWVLIGALHTLFYKNSVVLTIFMHKLVLLVFLMLSGFFFHRLCRRLGIDNTGLMTAAFIMNPLVVIMTLVDGHNEIAMVAFFLAALYFLYKSKYVVSILLFTAAVQVKFAYVLLAPFFFLYILLGPGKKRTGSRIYEILTGGVLSLGLLILLWLPFGWRSVPAVVDYYRELNLNFWYDSIPYAVYFIMDKAGLTVSKQALAGVFSAAFLAIYVYLIWFFVRRVKTDRRAIFTVSSFVILALLFTNYTQFQPWYLLWVIPLILLSGFRTSFMLVFFLSYFLIMTFWKRMCVLAIPMVALYFFILSGYERYKGRLKFFFALD